MVVKVEGCPAVSDQDQNLRGRLLRKPWQSTRMARWLLGMVIYFLHALEEQVEVRLSKRAGYGPYFRIVKADGVVRFVSAPWG